MQGTPRQTMQAADGIGRLCASTRAIGRTAMLLLREPIDDGVLQLSGV
jgi:hypothetical protein